MLKKKNIKKYALEAIEKLPSSKTLCAVAIAILIAATLYSITLFLLSR